MSNNEKTVTELREIAARLNEKRYVIHEVVMVQCSKMNILKQTEKKNWRNEKFRARTRCDGHIILENVNKQ